VTITVVKASSSGQLAELVPNMLGFEPKQSIVVICLNGERMRVGLVMRFDLSDHPHLAPSVAVRIEHEAPDWYAVFVYTDEADDHGMHPYHGLVDNIASVVAATDVQVALLDTVLVRDGQWSSYLCPDACCHGAVPISDITAEYIGVGGRILASRDELAATLAHDGSTDFDDSYTPIDIVSHLVPLCLKRAAGEPLDNADLDGLVMAICDNVIDRDRVLCLGVDPELHTLPDVLAAALRRTPDFGRPQVASTLAFIAYAQGDGATANLAVDIALAIDPEYSLAILVMDTIERQLPPALLQEVMRGAADDLAERQTADKI
jgi:Domain of unknown function (DUF4192)